MLRYNNSYGLVIIVSDHFY